MFLKFDLWLTIVFLWSIDGLYLYIFNWKRWLSYHVSPRKMSRTVFTSCWDAQIVPSISTSYTWSQMLSYSVTSATLLLQLPCYFCYFVTSVTLSLLLPCFFSYFVTSVTLFLQLLCYFCYLVSSVTLLPQLPCYFCYLITSVTLLIACRPVVIVTQHIPTFRDRDQGDKTIALSWFWF